LKRLGRGLLWCLVGVLLLRGAGDVLSADERTSSASPARVAAVGWPDDEARAFAVDFARAYLSYSPRHSSGYERELRRFVSTELVGSIRPAFAERRSRQVVMAATVARTAVVDRDRALVTVAATVVAGDVETRYLTVPIARDRLGGLAVFDLPSFVAPPSATQAEPTEVEPLVGRERAEIEDVVGRFFRAYLGGDARALEYLVPAGVRMGALGERHELAGLVSLALTTPAAGRSREVAVTVRARDVKSRAVFPLRYRLRLVRGDRWYVAAVNNSTRKGG
jgi:hypothetical protein